MKMFSLNRFGQSGAGPCISWMVAPLLLPSLATSAFNSHAQSANHASLSEQIKEVSELRRQMVQGGAAISSPAPYESASTAPSSASGTPEELAAAARDIRERQAVEESQIETHEQTKVETESRYPIKVTGMLLLNGFVNTSAVDMAATPTVALAGPGSAGASVRQTILGIDARGPHLFGASSFADLRVDFSGSPAINTSTTSYPSYYNVNSTLLRLRTAHAGLQWDHIQAFFSLDHPIISPESPTSLTAVAEPPLAWSGNLWTWNPQGGVTVNLEPSGLRGVQIQAALIDAGDAPLTPVVAPSGASTAASPSSAEQSSRPGVEARVALYGSDRD